MKKLGLVLTLGLGLVACEKEDDIFEVPMEPTLIVEPPKEPETPQTETESSTLDLTGTESSTTNIDEDKDETPEVETGTETETVSIENTNGAEFTDLSSNIDLVPSGQASTVLVGIHDDGKDNISHIYRIVNSDTQLVQRVDIIDADGYPIGFPRYAWNNFTEFEINVSEGHTFTSEIRGYTEQDVTVNGITVNVRVVNTRTIDINELREAIELAGDNWVNRQITVLEYIDGNNGYAAGPIEMLIDGDTGFNKRTLLHENGHNFDFRSSAYTDALTMAIYDNLPEIHAHDVTLEQFPYVEFKAEAFAWYYLWRNDLPSIVVSILDMLLG